MKAMAPCLDFKEEQYYGMLERHHFKIDAQCSLSLRFLLN